MKGYNSGLTVLLAGICAFGLFLAASGCASTQVSDSDEEEIEVGYGTQKKGESASAISTVSGEKVRRQRATTYLADLLEGNVAGVHVAATSSGIQVRIRGNSSIYGSNDPLYVVDGTPVEPDPGGTLSSVNPYDVESITVLKDAGSTAIYGSRGANGVIIVKTKSP